MFRLYTPLLILQAFCLYHAYRNNAQQRWYWFIIFIPGIGCAIYLFENLYSKKNIETIAEGVKVVINSNYKIEQLEKALRFNDSLTNKIQLAEAYVNFGRYSDAIALYLDCLTGYMAEDPKLRMKLLEAYFLNGDYESATTYGSLLEGEKQFKNSLERVQYGWALHRIGNTQKAEVVFEDFDKPFTNFKQRLEYCKFLIETNQADKQRQRITALSEELEHMKGPERKFYRDVVREIRDLHSSQKSN